MFEVSVNGKTEKADVSFYTAWLYENEFHADLISDFYGVQDMSPIASSDGDSYKVDFTKVNWMAATRVLWAALKTASQSTPPYPEWMKSTRGVDTYTLRQQLDEAIADCFFRPGTAEPEE
jgi:hypothetical protein